MNYNYLILFLLFWIVSCNPEDDRPSIVCGSPSIISEDGTRCVCPDDGFLITDTETGDIDCSNAINEFDYKFYLDSTICFNDGWTNHTDTGYFLFKSDIDVRFIFARSSYSLDQGQHSGMKDINLIKHPDGRVELSMVHHFVAPQFCYDWKDNSNCPNVIKGYIHGISNPENTVLDLHCEYRDCEQFVVSEGYIHMFK